ncbi:hemolysin family protein [Amnibacterium endophyticum]|uniref:Hemolysin family protein n=1 Tax=Amnibacterium endophyticum TaxID=2109337 RepID=A0ABW4LD25_9MICO
MNVWLPLVVTVLLIAASAFFVAIEFALIGARRHRLEADAERSRGSRAALRGMNELTLMLAGAQLGITACTFALGAVTKPAVDGLISPLLEGAGLPVWLAGGAAFVLSLLVVTFLHLVVGEMVPKSWTIAHPETAAKLIGIPSRAFVAVFRPFLTIVNRAANAVVRRVGVEPVDSAAVGGRDAGTIRNLVEYSARMGVFEPRLHEQIADVIDLERLTVGEITRRGEPTAVPPTATAGEVRAVARETGHLRILVRDDAGGLPGVVHVRDTLVAADGEPVSPFASPVLTTDAATPVYGLLRQMRERRVQLAVVEESGGAIGVVTLDDLIRRVLPEAAPAG